MANGSLDDLQDLETSFRRSASSEVRPSHLIRLVKLLRQILQRLEQTRAVGDRRLDDVEQFVGQLQDRLLIVDTLPAEAPLGAIIRVRTGTIAERATIYYGNGAGQPITKSPVPTAV